MEVTKENVAVNAGQIQSISDFGIGVAEGDAINKAVESPGDVDAVSAMLETIFETTKAMVGAAHDRAMALGNQ